MWSLEHLKWYGWLTFVASIVFLSGSIAPRGAIKLPGVSASAQDGHE